MDASNTQPYHLPKDAVWFITGCSSGIGASLARLIAAHPTHRLVATARDPRTLAPLTADSTNKHRTLALALDVTSPASVAAALDAAVAAFGRIDVVVNNAGYGLRGDAEATGEAAARALLETDFWGAVRVATGALRVMREDNAAGGGGGIGGVVLNVSSMGGFIGFPGGAFYHAAKFAVEGFTEAVAKEVRPEWNIHFCLIEPGGVQTNYATTSMQRTEPHPAYAAADTPARMLEAYASDPQMRERWAKPEAIAAAMIEVVSSDRRIPLRLPLGTDAWGMIKAEIGRVDKDLDEFRELSEKVGDPKQLESIQFLRKV